MTWEVFERAMEWVKFLYDRGLEKELSFTGIGESTLHPRFIDMLDYARNMCPSLPIVFSTNGLPSFTDEIAESCVRLDVGVMVSLHRPEVAGRTVKKAFELGILKYVNNAFAVSAFDWAGQVPTWFNTAQSVPCDYLKQGWGVVLADGKITTCCIDSEGLGVVGTVWDKPGSLFLKPFDLCKNCHMKVP